MSASWQDGMRAVHADAGGAFMVEPVRPEDVPALLVFSLAGNTEAARVLQLYLDTARNLEAAPRAKRMLCATCPKPVRAMTCTIVVAIPARSDPSMGLALAVCRRCGPDRAAVMAQAVVGLRKIWPDLRPIDITHPEGSRA